MSIGRNLRSRKAASASGRVSSARRLTDLTASVNSQVDGGTASTITCVDGNGTIVASGTTDPNGDGSASATNLEPGTYTCTLVIDP